MTTPDPTGIPEQNEPQIQPKMTPEQMLSRLLELIRSNRYRSDFTPERVSQAMGVEVKRAEDGSGDYSFYEPATSEWLQGFDFNEKYARFVLRFDPIKVGASPDMTRICQFNFDRFATELVAMGFTKTPSYGEHGQLMDYKFERTRDGRGEMMVTVYPGGSVKDEQTGTLRTCMRMIYIF